MVRFDANGFPLWDECTLPYDYGLPRDIDEPSIPVTLVCGPPASGKTSYVEKHKSDRDIVIDMDDIKVSVGGKRWDTCPDVFDLAIVERDRLLRSLHASTAPHAWVIHTGERPQARSEWARRLGCASIVVINTPANLCISRIKADVRRRYASGSQIAAVKRWHEYNDNGMPIW